MLSAVVEAGAVVVVQQQLMRTVKEVGLVAVVPDIQVLQGQEAVQQPCVQRTLPATGTLRPTTVACWWRAAVVDLLTVVTVVRMPVCSIKII
jgi:hypothetical protein